ncbi:MAG: hypothetical protein HUJ73_00360, partial [Eubacterium sp.]|nr:hypothetical protein [Eubacterium sp.]
MKMKKAIALTTIASIITTASMTSVCFADGSAKDALKEHLIKNVQNSLTSSITGETDTDLDIYKNILQASTADKLPDKLDLRDRGVVPEVREQNPFGTCWGFAAIGATEISILSDLGMTVQEFKDLAGTDLDLSERHLAWFASVPLSEVEGMSEHELAQVGEGRTLLEDDGSAHAHFDIGGFMGYAACLFASGTGPATEEMVPYKANDGSFSTAADWSVDESLRFVNAIELKDSSMLPAPAGRDENGNYVYNEIATEMIKQELLDGHAVSIAYHSDQAMDPDARMIIFKDIL